MYKHVYYIIRDKCTNEILKNEDGSTVKRPTIKDCLEYLWYRLKVDDNFYEFLERHE